MLTRGCLAALAALARAGCGGGVVPLQARHAAAAHTGDAETFHKHMGPAFSRKESDTIMSKVKSGIDSGAIPLKR
jgi:hypothetical protein